jgi:hypothetical protein
MMESMGWILMDIGIRNDSALAQMRYDFVGFASRS